MRERRAEMRVAAAVVRKEAREGEAGGAPAAELGGVGREVWFVMLCWWWWCCCGFCCGEDVDGVCGRASSWERSLASSSS